MKVGLVGAGKAGCSLGKYLKLRGTEVTGYFSRQNDSAKQAAQFTNTRVFDSLEQIVQESDFLWLTTPDDAIVLVWEELRKLPFANQRMVGHCSGSLSSSVFAGRQQLQVYGCSIHPLVAFCDREHSYEALADAVFTLEGDAPILARLQAWLEGMGNSVQVISAEKKSLYHCAAVTVSNHVAALLQTGIQMLQECGFGREQAQQALLPLFQNNSQNLLQKGLPQALTGPVERGDCNTIAAHLGQLSGADAALYQNLSARLLPVAQAKHPERDYTQLQRMMEGWK